MPYRRRRRRYASRVARGKRRSYRGRRRSTRSHRGHAARRPNRVSRKWARSRTGLKSKALSSVKRRLTKDPTLAPAFRGLRPQTPLGLKYLFKGQLPNWKSLLPLDQQTKVSATTPYVRTVMAALSSSDIMSNTDPIKTEFTAMGITGDALQIKATNMDVLTAANEQIGAINKNMADKYDYYLVQYADIKLEFYNYAFKKWLAYDTAMDEFELDARVYALICVTNQTSWPTDLDEEAEILRHQRQIALSGGKNNISFNSGFQTQGSYEYPMHHTHRYTGGTLYIRELPHAKHVIAGDASLDTEHSHRGIIPGKKVVSLRVRPHTYHNPVLSKDIDGTLDSENLTYYIGAVQGGLHTDPTNQVNVFVRYIIRDGTGTVKSLQDAGGAVNPNRVMLHYDVRQCTTWWSPKSVATDDDPENAATSYAT
jgi:hypothetical protein